MLRIALVFAVAVGCSKAKDKDQTPPPSPPPAVADAAATEDASADVGSAGSATGSSDAGSAAGSDAGSAAAAGGVHFDDLSRDDKIKFMKEQVMPAMKPLFRKFDAKEFAKVNCKTCHGKDPKGSKYEMPSKDLPALDFDAIKAGKEDPEMVEFMSKVVKPEMAKLLGEAEATESNPDGFGCLACHTMKKK